MMASPLLKAAWEDMLFCLGLGVLLAFLRDGLELLLGSGPLRKFALDVFACCLAAVLLCGYTASASRTGVTRWYMAGGMAVGAFAWHGAISGAVQRAALCVGKLLLFPLRLLQKAAQMAKRQLVCRWHTWQSSAQTSKKQKKAKKMLQNARNLYYN